MNKTEFIKSLADEHELDRPATKMMVDMVFDHLRSCIVDHRRVSMSDFGIFTAKFRRSRSLPNNLSILSPEVRTPARLVVKFRPAKSFKGLLIEEGLSMEDVLDDLGDDDDEEDIAEA